MDIGTDAFIPPTYIGNEFQKLDIYKRIAGIESMEESEEMLEELLDRFGEPPKSVQNLLMIAQLKARAHGLFIKEIKQTGNELKIVTFTMDPEQPYFVYALKRNTREKDRDVLEVLSELLEKMQILLPHNA